MAERIHTFDWASTSLGCVETGSDRLRFMVEQVLASPLVSSLVCGPKRVLIYNDAAARLYGDRHPSALGRPLPESFPETYPVVEPLYERAFLGETVHVPAQPLDLGGGEVFDAYLTPVRDEAGVVIAVHMVGFEISDRMRTEAALRKSEDRLTRALEAGDVGTWELDLATLEAWRSPQHDRIFGYETLLPDWTYDMFLAHVVPEDRGWVDACFQNAIAADGVWNFECRIQRLDGEPRWIGAQGRIDAGASGRSRQMKGTVRDITERKRGEITLRESEERFQYVVRATHDIVWDIDLVADRVWWSEALQTELGFSPEQIGPDTAWCFAHMHPDDRERVVASMKEAAAGTGHVWSAEFRYQRADGTYAHIADRGFITRDVSGRALRMTGAMQDITSRKLAEITGRESEERQAFLLKFSDALRAEPDADAVATCALQMLFDHLHLDRCYITDYRPADDEADFPYQFGNDTVPPLPDKVRLSDFPDAYEQVLDRTFVVEDDLERRGLSQAERASSKALGMRAMVASTVRRGGKRPLCSMAAVSSRPRRWSPGEIALVEEAAERTWAAIEHARAEAALHESEQALAIDLANAERLRSLAERLVSEVSFESVYDEVLAAIVAIARADAGTIQIYDPATKSLKLIASLNFSRSVSNHFEIVDAGSRTACGLALKTGTRAFVDFPDEVTDLGCQLLVGEGIKSAVALPLVSRTGTPLGMLNAHWRTPRHRPGERELRFLDLLARQTADLIEQRQAQGALRESEERLRQFGEASSDVLWIRDAETLQWIYLTPAFETIYGLERETALRDDNLTGWLDLIVPEDRQIALDGIQRVREGERATFEYRIRRPGDGEVRWLRDTDFPMHNAAGKVCWIGGVGREITEEKETAAYMDVLVAELQHRTRNLMGVVRATADKTLHNSTDLADFKARYGTRLEALSRVQGLLSRLAEGERVTFDELIEGEIAALNGEVSRVSLNGPKGVALRSSTVQTFALALHELATNALKYGALAQPQAHLQIRWRIEYPEQDGHPWLHVDWREYGVRMPRQDTVRKGGGSGRELIERALPYQLGAKTTYMMAEDGVHCTIALPVSERTRERGHG